MLLKLFGKNKFFCIITYKRVKMRKIINNDLTKNKPLEYNKNSFSGKIELKYDGQQLTKISKNVYQYSKDGVVEEFHIKGNVLKVLLFQCLEMK